MPTRRTVLTAASSIALPAMSAPADMPHLGSHMDERAFRTGFDHAFGASLSDEEGGFYIQIDNCIIILLADLPDRLRAVGPRVIDENVERFMIREEGRDGFEIGDVERSSDSAKSRIAQLRHNIVNFGDCAGN